MYECMNACRIASVGVCCLPQVPAQKRAPAAAFSGPGTRKSRGAGARGVAWRGVAWRGQLLIDFRPPRAANAPARGSIPTSSRNPEGALELPLPSLCIFASSPSSLQYSAFILFSPRLTHLARRRVCPAWTARLSLHRHSIIIPPPSRRAPREHPPNPPATQRLREPSPHPHCSSDAAQSPEVFWRNNRPSDATRRCTR